MNEIKKMYCPSCGAPVQFQPGREDTFCSSCGMQLFMHDDHLEMKLKHEEVKMKMQYEDMSDEREHEIKKMDTEYRNEIKSLIIGTIILFAAALFVLFLTRLMFA